MNLNVSEIFSGLQAEGMYTGCPSIFLRLQKCTRNCSFCDTQYHKIGKSVPISTISNMLNSQSLRTIVLTGGEPLLQWKAIVALSNLLKSFTFHIETNGDLLYSKKVSYSDLCRICKYVAISPKELSVAKQLHKELPSLLSKVLVDIKVVTDVKKIGVSMIPFATLLMPLTTNNVERDNVIRRDVWNYCVQHNIRYSPRLHVEVWGYKCRGK